MTLEHRLCKRVEVLLDVIVRGHDGLTLHGRTRDISPHGMFIQLASGVISGSTAVEIELAHRRRLHGWVVHAGDEGIGVMFRSVGSSEREYLTQLLSGKS